MNKTLASVLVTLALTVAVRAETTAKISNVHLCCQSCVKGVEKAVADVKGVTATVDKDAGTVTLAGDDQASVQKAADALVAAGYYGKADSGIKLASDSGATGKKVKTLKVEGVHLCCGKCVSAVDKAVKSVSGVEGDDAKKGADSFNVTGDFNDRDVMNALEKAGLHGKVGK